MGDSDEVKQKAGVPSWQLKSARPPPTEKNDGQDTATQPVPSREAIIERAKKFLQEDEVRNAPTDKQVAFLEGKGLESDEIQKLLGVTRNTEATSSEKDTTPLETPTKSISQPPPLKPQTNPDIPPIITYPEFLTTPPQPAPLVTASRLLTTLYIFGGLSALLYGTSNYLIKPMVASLTSSRHELAGTAQTNLDKLIVKLGGMVSETPQKLLGSRERDVQDSDSDSDPSELFHRDIGVQTSLPTTPTQSRPASPPPATRALDEQSRHLHRLTSHIRDLNEASTSEGQDVANLSTTVSVLREYLDSLAYIPPTYSYGSGGGMYGGNQKQETLDDEISKVKAQIRGVKGVLLSARSFPGGAIQRQSTMAR